MSDRRYRSTEDECLWLTVVSECRSTGIVPGSTVVDENQLRSKCCCRSMRNALLFRLNAPSLQDLVRIAVEFPCCFWYMPNSTRSNKDKRLLFSEDHVHLERTIHKDQCSTSLDAATFTSTYSRNQPSTDTRPSSSTDPHRSTSIDTTPLTSIDPQSRNMVAIVILRQDENGDLYDQDGHLCNATGHKLDA
ncbi:hypothetical protein F2Q69_00013325 [Brassica cretica]|uniref:Uncharacterized protein n=1 Tax=Brassica cretica TaxID=69181 RepID=A0A8S9R0K5_BRACR|nr:hypothetical protein F2Q69_00013325 [Brassica cretica]